MNIGQIVINFIQSTRPEYLAWLAGVGFLIIAGALWIRLHRPRFRQVIAALLCLLLIRVLLFDQPFSWAFYNNHLSVDDIGWRQQSAVFVEKGKFYKNYRPIKFLAVGSSQTYVIYSPYSKKHNDLVVFNFAGMTMLDLYLYRHYIAAKEPQYVLLYLSEFDLAKEPRLDAAKLAPNQGWDFWNNYFMLQSIAHEAGSQLSLKEMIVGEFFPEYKYAFIFKGLLDRFTGKNKALSTKSLYESLNPDADELKRGLEGLINSLDERWIYYNRHFLQKFLQFCRRNNMRVIMVEGQYNPLATNTQTQVLNQQVRWVLEDLSRQWGAVFIPRKNTKEFQAHDYMDAEHVLEKPAIEFVDRLMSHLQRIL